MAQDNMVIKEQILLKYGEIVLKGLNKHRFEELLISNLKRRIKDVGNFRISKAQSTVYVEPMADEAGLLPDMDEASRRISQVFGIAAYARAAVVAKDFNHIAELAPIYWKEALMGCRTFKVDAKRSDKKFPMNSPEICSELGHILLETFPHLTVDIHNPQVTVTVEIRETAAFLHALKLQGAGGIPVGSSGKAMLLLSGGIDSPVAGWMIAKRGVELAAVHFASPPYTSPRARLKVEKLCDELTSWCGRIPLYYVPLTKVQEAIRDYCPEDLSTVILRRMMLRLAERIAEKTGSRGLITGESIGQVASQTMGAIVCTDAVANMPVFRPVIGMDKSEITTISRRIGTFETSIEPFEDCCTIFTPKHPKTNPKLAEIEKAENESGVDFEALLEETMKEIELKIFPGNHVVDVKF